MRSVRAIERTIIENGDKYRWIELDDFFDGVISRKTVQQARDILHGITVGECHSLLKNDDDSTIAKGLLFAALHILPL